MNEKIKSEILAVRNDPLITWNIMYKYLGGSLLVLACGFARATPIDITLSATLPPGNTPSYFTTSFLIDSAAPTTDVYTDPTSHQTFYGYSRAALSGFGFALDGFNYTVDDISVSGFAAGHVADLYLAAPIASGLVEGIWMHLQKFNENQALMNISLGQGYYSYATGSFIANDFIVSDYINSYRTSLQINSAIAQPNTVPEPAGLSLMSLGLAICALMKSKPLRVL